MAGRGWTALIWAGVLAATPSLAKQTEPLPAGAKAAPTVSAVTVTAEKPDPLVDPAGQYVREHLPESAWSEQYPRFHDEICVKVQGLPAEFDGFVAKRIVELAGQVGAPLDKAADCKPNVNVIFTTKPQAQIDDIAKRKDILLGFRYVAQEKRITTFDRPIQAWYTTRVIDANGNPWVEVKQTCPYNPMFPHCDRPGGRAGSRLTNEMSAEIIHSLIIADANKVAGEKIDAVADYVAVLALARWTGLNRCNRIPTVLNLMADECADPPETATPEDVALLKALYSVGPRDIGFMQRSTIASAVRKAHAARKATAQ
ncbi:MAG: hypothetical protein JSS35_01300 [Proteobacteria bacterium]|nr:hypothetical protein [Pseudomonadota bacterium]